MQTVAQTLARGIAALGATSETPRADAMLLLARALERDREWIVAHPEAAPLETQAARFDAFCEVRKRGTPLAYVLGSAGFFGREFAVDHRVLVPRPETEHLIDEALAFLKPREPATVLDVGAGSGAIACTIAAEIGSVFVEGTDVSPDAVDVAESNARKLGVAARCRFWCGDLAEPVGERRFDVVLANLPYVPTRDLPTPPNPVGFEPRGALDGGADGLKVYRRFLPVAPALLNPGGLLLLEAAPPQVGGLLELAAAAFPGVDPLTGEDFAGLARYVKVRLPAR
ncbi:MAG: peptide chain release factor N(5)-glutamine methyltransferase [Candidatus Tumulicola sp.]